MGYVSWKESNCSPVVRNFTGDCLIFLLLSKPQRASVAWIKFHCNLQALGGNSNEGQKKVSQNNQVKAKGAPKIKQLVHGLPAEWKNWPFNLNKYYVSDGTGTVVLNTFVINLRVTGSWCGGVEGCLCLVLLQARVIVDETMGHHCE